MSDTTTSCSDDEPMTTAPDTQQAASPQVSERDVILRERAAAWRVFRYFDDRGYFTSGHECGTSDNPRGEMERVVKNCWPLPSVTRPRVIKDSDGYEFRVVDGDLQWRASGEWNKRSSAMVVRCCDVPKIVELFANPTETVPEDEA